MSVPRRRHSGLVLIYVIVAMAVLVGFSSLAVDWGRVQLVRTELQRTADAAARYAVTGLSTSAALAQTYAITAAAENTADGSSVVLQAGDIVTGNWNTTTRVFVPNGTPRNAVQVVARRASARGTGVQLVWGRLWPGTPTVIDVAASSIAYSAPVSTGLFGNYVNEGINMSGSAVMDSYNSKGASYASTKGANFSVAGNFNYANFNGGTKIDGKVYYTGNAPNGTATGGKTKINSSDIPNSMKTASTTPGGATNKGNYNGGNMTLNSGNYYFQNFSANGNSTITINANNGPVRLYVNGAFSLSGNVSFEYTQGTDPADLELHMVASAGVDLSGNVELHAVIHAPNSPMNLNGNSQVFGSINMKQVSLSGNVGVHWDTNLPTYGGSESNGAGGEVSLVR